MAVASAAIAAVAATETLASGANIDGKVVVNLADELREEQAKTLARKVELLSGVKQSLAMAADYGTESKVAGQVADMEADKAGSRLYQGAAAGLVSLAEVSATLGDVFGYKPKKDGTPGKTPEGRGEAIRKRIVRAVSAYEYVTNQGKPDFFAGLPIEEVEAVVYSLNDGGVTLWTAYDSFAAIKKEYSERAEPLLNPDKVAKMAETIVSEAVTGKIRDDKVLQAAYLNLLDAIQQAFVFEIPA